MTARLDAQTLGLVFRSRPDILASIQNAADTPARTTLFNDIAAFVYEQLASTDARDGPASKRRRVDIAQAPAQTPQSGHTSSRALPGRSGSQTAGPSAEAAIADPVLLEIKDISVAAPQRKKYDLCFTKNLLYARASGASIPVQGIVYPWKDFEYAFYLPVPDKSQAQYNYVLLPRGSYLPSAKQTGGNQALEPLVFTVPATAPKPGSVSGPSAKTAEAVSDTYGSLFHWALTTSMRAAGNHSCRLVAADPKVFHSVARQAHRPDEKAVHVKAFRGSKDGFLFFLPTGIFWGFKKPLMFLPLDRVVAVSYTNILRTTFNMVVELDGDGAGLIEKEIEFGMLDQGDYQGIDETYVRRHGLADRSMADQRKAKRQLAENGKKPDVGGETGDGGDEAVGMTELERANREAEQQLQDEEDELEEDYDPGSEEQSEGEGVSSDEADEDEDEDEDEEEEEEEEEEVQEDSDGGGGE